MDRKRIAIITDAWHPQINGVVTTIENLVREGKKRGHDIHVISPQTFNKKFYTKHYPEIPLTLPFGLSKILNDIKPDCVHIATEGPIGLAASLILTLKGKSYTTSYQGCFEDC